MLALPRREVRVAFQSLTAIFSMFSKLTMKFRFSHHQLHPQLTVLHLVPHNLTSLAVNVDIFSRVAGHGHRLCN